MGIMHKKLTSHGSVSNPVSMRRELGMEPKDPVILEIGADNKITISPYAPRCIFCGIQDEIITYQSKGICATCAERVAQLMKGRVEE